VFLDCAFWHITSAIKPEQFDRTHMQFDVIAVGDFRFPGGTSSALASEVSILANAGYRVALMAMEGNVLRYPHPMHPSLRKLVDEGRAWLVPPQMPIEASLCLLHHPQVFERWPHSPPCIKAEQTLMIVHHPLMDSAGEAYYDWVKIDAVARGLFGDVRWAPVGPKVRAQFSKANGAPKLHDSDWLNVLDCDAGALPRQGFMGARPQIGRHSRRDPAKWPADRASFLAAYPDDPNIDVHLMGFGAALEPIAGKLPKNWQVLPFGAMDPREFLARIDYFVYYHHPRWVEAYGRSILEAMASGAVPVLAPHFRPLFGDGAVYTAAENLRETVLDMHASPARYLAQARRGVDMARQIGDKAVLVDRVKRLIGAPSKKKAIVSIRARRPKVMFFTSNGVGMGHLTRALSVARRLPEQVDAVMLTLSKAFGLAQRDGIHAEYIPYHKSIDMPFEEWNIHLEREVKEALAFHQPDVFVFDGNVPYGGLVAALDAHPGLWKVWMRRGFWAPGMGVDTIGRETHFDAVIEPQDVAQAWDRGATTTHRRKTMPVPPIRYLRSAETQSRAEARAELGIPDDSLAVLVQLGAGNNFDMSHIRNHILGRLLATPGITVVLADWLIAAQTKNLPDAVIRVQEFPLSARFAAFDFSVSAVGYNSYHEVLAAGLPTLFIPNESGEQDEQHLRARYAAVHGMGFAASSTDIYAADAALTALLDADQRADIRAACASLNPENGAYAAARYVADLAMMRRQIKQSG